MLTRGAVVRRRIRGLTACRPVQSSADAAARVLHHGPRRGCSPWDAGLVRGRPPLLRGLRLDGRRTEDFEPHGVVAAALGPRRRRGVRAAAASPWVRGDGRDTVAGIAAHEPRTLAYAVHALAGEPDVRIFYELYTSEDALAEHESQTTTRYFLDRVDDFVTSVDVQRLRLVTATGIADLPPAERPARRAEPDASDPAPGRSDEDVRRCCGPKAGLVALLAASMTQKSGPPGSASTTTSASSGCSSRQSAAAGADTDPIRHLATPALDAAAAGGPRRRWRAQRTAGRSFATSRPIWWPWASPVRDACGKW